MHVLYLIQMNKIIIALLILSPLWCNSQSKDSLTFKIHYSPETKYTSSIEQTSHSEMAYRASDEFLQNLKEKGIQNPTITTKKSTIETVFKTGKQADDAVFPLTIEIVKTTSSDGNQLIPDGLLIYGHGTTNKMPTLDSIASNDVDEEFKKALLTSMQSIFTQINFPEKQLKVGESFSVDTPLSMPIADVTLDMEMTTNYKLLSIINGIADFEVSSVFTMKSSITKYPINATGKGKGSLLYDVSKNFYPKYETDMEMNMNMKIGEVDFSMKIKSGYNQTTKITKNKK